MTPEQAHEHVLLHSERVPEQHEAEWREVARVIARLQAELEARVKQNETQIRIHEQNTSEWKSALESLQSERDALKEQQGQFWDTMRAIAVKGLGLTDPWDLDKDAPMPEDWAAFPTMSANIASVRAERDALAEQVRVMREDLAMCKAQIDIHELTLGKVGQVAMDLRLALKRLHSACVDATECGEVVVEPHHEAVTEAYAALQHKEEEAEAQAKANAEKAALLDWLDHTRPSLSFGYSPEYPLGAWGIYWTNAQTEQVEDAEAERLPDALRAAREHESNG